MGETLIMAGEMQAYTLADRGTFLSMSERLPLKVLSQGDPSLLNPYGVITVSKERHPHVNADLAKPFVEYLTRYDTQHVIGGFGVDRFGEPLFFPDSEAWRVRNPAPSGASR